MFLGWGKLACNCFVVFCLSDKIKISGIGSVQTSLHDEKKGITDRINVAIIVTYRDDEVAPLGTAIGFGLCTGTGLDNGAAIGVDGATGAAVGDEVGASSKAQLVASALIQVGLPL